MKNVFFFVAMVICGLSSAQHSTLNFSNEPIQLNQQSVLLVPFDSRMYSSDINKDLAEYNQLNTQQIIQRFTQGIDQAILYTFQDKCNVTSFYQLDDEESKGDLGYIYEHIDFEYELVSETTDKTTKEKLKAKLKKNEDNSYQRGSIQGGEIVTHRDDRKRYMKAVIKNNMMLDSMHFKFDNRFFLFVNQLDLKNDYSDLIAVQQGSYNRTIDLHYTLYSKEGEILTTGISSASFPSQQNDINEIVKNNFPKLAENIYNDLFLTDEKEENNSKLKLNKLWK